MNLAAQARRLTEQEQVTFVARGGSMEPRVRNGSTVTIVRATRPPRRGDVALAKVRGRWYLHLVSAVHDGAAQISNNKGRVNGWTPFQNVVGFLA